MARNKFGVICDICGKYEEGVMKQSYYHLVIPTWDDYSYNGIKCLDYCPECYKKLKIALAQFYHANWFLEVEDNAE